MSATDVLVLVLGLLLGSAVGAIVYSVLRPSPRGGEVRLTITRGALPPIAPSRPTAGPTTMGADARTGGEAFGDPDATPVGPPELDPPFVVAEAVSDGPQPRWRARADAIPVAQGDDPTFARLVNASRPSQAVPVSSEGGMTVPDTEGGSPEPAVVTASVAGSHGPQVAATAPGGHGPRALGSLTGGDAPLTATGVARGMAPPVSPAFAWVAPATVPRASHSGSGQPDADASVAIQAAPTAGGPATERSDIAGPVGGASPTDDGFSGQGDASPTDDGFSGQGDAPPTDDGFSGQGETPSSASDALPTDASGASTTSVSGASTAPGGEDPCAAERRLVEERCALAARLRDAHRAAGVQQREVRQAYEAATSMAEAARRSIDGRVVLEGKTEAQRRFRRSRLAATSAAELETAATIWLEEIDRINRAVRQGRATLTREQQRATHLMASMDEISVRVDAARISAEGAEERCREAREALASCEEARSSLGTGRPGTPRAALPPFMPSPAGPEPTDHEPLPSAAGPTGSDASFPTPTILRIARGEEAALARILERLAGGSAEEERRWQLWLGEFLRAIRAAAIDAGALEFPLDHPFWSTFTQAQCRDIAMALASLGFRYDGERGFADDRLPSQRDLSLAVGYAGLDPLRIRRWPGEAGMSELYEGVTVATDEYLAAATPDLTLSELVQALGRRAETLTDLWNAWGRVRPLLLASS